MTASNFAFLQTGWPELLAKAQRSEAACHTDPRAACFHAWRTLELAVAWLYRAEAGAGGACRTRQTCRRFCLSPVSCPADTCAKSMQLL